MIPYHRIRYVAKQKKKLGFYCNQTPDAIIAGFSVFYLEAFLFVQGSGSDCVGDLPGWRWTEKFQQMKRPSGVVLMDGKTNTGLFAEGRCWGEVSVGEVPLFVSPIIGFLIDWPFTSRVWIIFAPGKDWNFHNRCVPNCPLVYLLWTPG